MNLIRHRFVFRALIIGAAFSVAGLGAEKKKDTTRGAAANTETHAAASAKVDVNTADVATLETLPGVGPQTARAIVAARPFKSVADLERVDGIGPAKMKELKGLVTVSKPKSNATSATTPKRSSHQKVDINTADAATLESLPGVGPEIARAIIAARPFKSVDDLDRVRGIGTERLEQLRGEVFVSTPAVTKHKLGEPSLPPTGRKETAGSRSDVPAHHAPININTASQAELEVLPGIGPVKAAAIIEARMERPFKSKEDIMRVKGIKEGTFDEIKDLITVR